MTFFKLRYYFLLCSYLIIPFFFKLLLLIFKNSDQFNSNVGNIFEDNFINKVLIGYFINHHKLDTIQKLIINKQIINIYLINKSSFAALNCRFPKILFKILCIYHFLTPVKFARFL